MANGSTRGANKTYTNCIAKVRDQVRDLGQVRDFDDRPYNEVQTLLPNLDIDNIIIRRGYSTQEQETRKKLVQMKQHE